MSTKRTKPRPLIVGALYRVQTVEPGLADWWETLQWTNRGWYNRYGRKTSLSCNGIVQRVPYLQAPAEWKVVLLREYARKLEKAGGLMATWFPCSSSHRDGLVAKWFEVRRAKP